MDFNIRNLLVFDIGGIEVWITETALITWILMAVLIVFAIIVRVKLKKFEDVPTGKLQNTVEAIIEMFERFIHSTVGEKLSYLGNWYFTVFAIILLSNFSGVIGIIRPPTADWSFTVAMAISTFVIIQVMGFKYRRGAYAKNFLTPSFVFLPVNIIGELARPISLSFRLFGNMLAGLILMTMIYTLPPVAARFGIPAVMHIYFDLITGFLQTYIFCVLSLSFIGGAAGVETE